MICAALAGASALLGSGGPVGLMWGALMLGWGAASIGCDRLARRASALIAETFGHVPTTPEGSTWAGKYRPYTERRTRRSHPRPARRGLP